MKNKYFELDFIDYLYEGVALILLIATIIYTITIYGSLPEEITRHFNIYGEPDAWSNKLILWILPVIALLLYSVLTLVSRVPDKFNYSFDISEKDKAGAYKYSVRMIRYIKTLMVLEFGYLVYSTVNVSKGYSDSLGVWSLPLFLGLLFLGIIYYIIRTKNIAK